MLQQTPNSGTLWSEPTYKSSLMLSDDQSEAVKWWIERFILSKYGKQFLLRREGFEIIESPKEFNRQKRRFPEYDFAFIPVGETYQVAIQPRSDQARWAEGVIYWGDDIKWHYTTGQFLKVEIIQPVRET